MRALLTRRTRHAPAKRTAVVARFWNHRGTDDIRATLERIEGKVDKLEGRFDQLENKVDRLESKVDRLESKVSELDVDNKMLAVKVTTVTAINLGPSIALFALVYNVIQR